MKINEHGLNDTIEEIERMIWNLEQARDIASSSAIPGDLGYGSNIGTICDEIDNIIYNLKRMTDWISEAVERFREARINSNTLVSELSTMKDLERAQKTGASVVNAGIAIGKGLASVGESIVDGFASICMYVWEMVNPEGTGLKVSPELETEVVREKTMCFVAEEHVENAYEDFYNNTETGKTLDKYAYEPFQSDGVGCELAEGVGYMAGLAAFAAVTGGTALGGGTIAMTSGMGKYTEEFWASLKDSSWEAMEKLYENGEITEEEFNSYIMVRAFSDEEWQQVEIDYENGTITSEEYEQMKTIREIPEKWTTKENMDKGLVYGANNGLWEGIQWYVGVKLAGWTIKGASPIVTSSVRVGIDTAFNALDTPVRAKIDSVINEKSYNEAWLEQGGWKSVLINAGIGLVGSVAGEVIDIKKGTKKSTDAEIKAVTGEALDGINTSKVLDNAADTRGIIEIDDKKIIFEDISQERVDEIVEILSKEHNLGKINLDSAETWATYIRQYNDRMPDLNTKGTFELNGKKIIFEDISQERVDEIVEILIEKHNIGEINLNFAEEWATYIKNYNDSMILDDFKNIMNYGAVSEQKVIDLALATFNREITRGNTDAKEILKAVIKLKKTNLDLTFEIATSGVSRWNKGNKVLYIDNDGMKIQDTGTFCHEMGHLLFSLKLNESLPDNWDDIVARARVESSKGGKLRKVGEQLIEQDKYSEMIATDELLEIVKCSTTDEYVNKLADEYIKNYGLSDQKAREFAITHMQEEIGKITEEINRTEYGGYCAISDIIDAVYLGQSVDLAGNEIKRSYSHGAKYYEKAGDFHKTLSFHEIIANFTQLKMNEDRKMLNQVKKIFGTEFYNTLEETFNKFLN